MNTSNDNSWRSLSKVSRWLIVLLLCSALLSLLAELLIHRHSLFDFESMFGFYALFGFISYLFIVRSASFLRRWLQRKEDYYD